MTTTKLTKRPQAPTPPHTHTHASSGPTYPPLSTTKRARIPDARVLAPREDDDGAEVPAGPLVPTVVIEPLEPGPASGIRRPAQHAPQPSVRTERVPPCPATTTTRRAVPRVVRDLAAAVPPGVEPRRQPVGGRPRERRDEAPGEAVVVGGAGGAAARLVRDAVRAERDGGRGAGRGRRREGRRVGEEGRAAEGRERGDRVLALDLGADCR